MLFVASQIVLCLLLAAAIGFIAGWLLRGLRAAVPHPVFESPTVTAPGEFSPPTHTQSTSSPLSTSASTSMTPSIASIPAAMAAASTLRESANNGLSAAPAQNPTPDPEIQQIRSELHDLRRVLADLARQRPVANPAPSTVALASSTAASAGLPDDLSMIAGVTPAIARTLNELGVTSFRQIAQWTPEDIAHIEDRLGSFGTRIDRDDWIQRAKELHALRHGESI